MSLPVYAAGSAVVVDGVVDGAVDGGSRASWAACSDAAAAQIDNAANKAIQVRQRSDVNTRMRTTRQLIVTYRSSRATSSLLTYFPISRRNCSIAL